MFSEKNTIAKSERMVRQLLSDNEVHSANLNALRTELQKANKTIEEWKIAVRQIRNEQNQQKEEHNAYVNEVCQILEKAAENSVFTNYQKHIEKAKAQIWQ